MTPLTLVPYSLVIQGIYTGLVETIGYFTMGTCKLVKSIYTHKNPDVNKILIELDIERKLSLVQSVVKSHNHICAEPVELCLKYLEESIKNIHDDLDSINRKIFYHRKKWFHAWRKINVEQQISSLKKNCKLLDSRFDDLYKISAFCTKN